MNAVRLMAVAFIVTLSLLCQGALGQTFQGTKYSTPASNTPTISPSGAMVCNTGYELYRYNRVWQEQYENVDDYRLDRAEKRETHVGYAKSAQATEISSFAKSMKVIVSGQFVCRSQNEQHIYVANRGADLRTDAGEGNGLYGFSSTFTVTPTGLTRKDHLASGGPEYRNTCDKDEQYALQGGSFYRQKSTPSGSEELTRFGIIYSSQNNRATGQNFHMNMSNSSYHQGELWLDNGANEPTWSMTLAKTQTTGDKEEVTDMVSWERTFGNSDGTVSHRFVLVVAFRYGTLNNQHGRLVLVEPGATNQIIGEVALSFWPGQIAIDPKSETAYVLQPELVPYGITTVSLNSLAVTGSESWVSVGKPISIAVDTASNKLFVGEFAAVSYPRTDYDYIYTKDLAANAWVRNSSGQLLRGKVGYRPDFIAIVRVAWDGFNGSNRLIVTNGGKKDDLDSKVQPGDFGLNVLIEDNLGSDGPRVETEQGPEAICSTR